MVTPMASEANHLDGIKCPKCDNETSFTVKASVAMRVTDRHVCMAGEPDWLETDFTLCDDCEHSGQWQDFRTDTEPGCYQSSGS